MNPFLILKKVVDIGYSFVIYRLPFNDTFRVIVNKDIDSFSGEFNFLSRTGFVFSPFRLSLNVSLFFVDFCSLTYKYDNLLGWSLIDSNNFDFVDSILNFDSSEIVSRINNDFSGHINCNFLSDVIVCQNYILEEELNKVVISRFSDNLLNERFDFESFFNELAINYSSSFVYLLYSPIIGFWSGASPELLINASSSEIKTVSLAGTKFAEPSINSDVNWSDKEIVEQDLVSKYIKDCFISSNIHKFKSKGPFTVRLGNLFHLKTEFTINLNENSLLSLQDIVNLIYRLHPTSAVGGMPRDRSLSVINAIEKYDRTYYTGFLGPVNMDKSQDGNLVDLYVNIRCMNVKNNIARLFAGAGITKDSVPENEYIETENKLNVLLSILKSNGFIA